MKTDPIRFIQGNTESLVALLNLIPLPVYIKDANGKYLACNQAFEETAGMRLADILGKDVYDIWPEKEAEIFDAKDKALYANPDTQDFESEVNTPSGAQHVVHFHKKIFYDALGKAEGYICVLLDNTEKKKLEQKLLTQALTDDLTQLANRREGMNRLGQMLSLSQRKNIAMCVALIDIDYFKKVNDTYGHAVGDAVLIAIANVMKKNLREYDICARYGGEEFMICLPDTQIEHAIAVLERLRKSCQEAQIETSSGDLVSATVSIGVAAYSEHLNTTQALLEASDLALYKAKAAGRNQVICLNK